MKLVSIWAVVEWIKITTNQETRKGGDYGSSH